MPFLPKIMLCILTVLLSALVLYLPFVAPPGLMLATQTGKTIYFLWALWLALPFTVAALFTRLHNKQNPFTATDLLFVAWVAWIAFRTLLQGGGFTLIAGRMGRCNRAGVGCTWGLLSKTLKY